MGEDEIFYSSLDEGYDEEEIEEFGFHIKQTNEMGLIPYNMLKLDQNNMTAIDKIQEERENV